MKQMALMLAASALCGCTAQRKPTTAPAATQPVAYQISLTAHPIGPTDSRDATPLPEALIHLDVYQLDVPLGMVSGSVAFWKRVDEQCLGVGAGDRLFKNGLRCGLARKDDWPFFRDWFDGRPNSVRKSTINGYHAQAVELELTKKIDAEDLFYFNPSNVLEGRSYESCVNLVSLSFQPAPRKPGAVRIALCPTVRAQRRRLEFTPLNQEYESPFMQVDRLYNLDLQVDVPEDQFLIVAPSEDSQRTTSIGGRFFIKNDKTEKLEQVLVIVPTYLPLDGKPVTLRNLSLGK
jgi:hypothetical protein